MHWLELLSTVEVPSNLLSLVRQRYDRLVSNSGRVVECKEFRIVDHTKHINVTEGMYTLLDIQISENHGANFKWYTSENFIGNCNIICIFAENITFDAL